MNNSKIVVPTHIKRVVLSSIVLIEIFRNYIQSLIN